MNFFFFSRKKWGQKYYEVDPNHRMKFYKDYLLHKDEGLSYEQWSDLQKTRG